MIVRKWMALSVVALGLAALVACGDDDGGDDFGGTFSEVEAESDYSCCLNGAYYECSSPDAVRDCAGGDVSGCTSAGDC